MYAADVGIDPWTFIWMMAVLLVGAVVWGRRR